MAKGKSAAALFEVIHGADRGRSSESKLSTPKWWFKSRKRGGGDSAPVIEAPPVSSYEPEPAPVAVASSGGGSRRRLVLPSSHAISLGLMLLAAAGVGFVVGQKYRPMSAPVIADETSEQLMTHDSRPDVLDVDSQTSAISTNNSARAEVAAVEPVAAKANAGKVMPNWNDPKPPTTYIVKDKQRVVGLNYVVVQSYPDKEADLANAAVQALAQSDIDATVVKGLPGWPSTWLSVVGTTGFDKIKASREYDTYVRSIQRVGDKFAGKNKFKNFSPQPYKWKTADPIAGARD